MQPVIFHLPFFFYICTYLLMIIWTQVFLLEYFTVNQTGQQEHTVRISKCEFPILYFQEHKGASLNMNTGLRWRLSLKYVPLNQIDMLRVRRLLTPEPSEPCRQFQCNLYQIDLFIAARCFFLLYLKVFYAQTWFHLAPILVTT